MKKILLIQPFPYKRSRRKVTSDRLPLGLLYIGETVRNRLNVDIRLLDLSLKDKTFDFSEYLFDFLPDVIGISVHSTSISLLSFQLTEFIKNKLPHSVIVGGGVHVSIDPINALKRSKFDIIVRGEGEEIFTNLISELNNNGNLNNIKGIVFKDKNAIIDTGLGPLPDIDALPIMPSTIIDLDSYDLDVPFMPKGKTINLITSRGCPYKCAFCSYKIISGTRIRLRSSENIIKEIENFYYNYNISNFYFVDDNFLISSQRIYDLGMYIKKRGLKIHWRCQSRADTFLKDMYSVKIISKIGCKHISFGVESGDQELLDRINKKLRLKNAEMAIKIAKENGIIVRLFLMVGLPFQDSKSIQKTIDFIHRTQPDEISVNVFVPYPGSPIYDNLEEWGIYINNTDVSKHICRTDWLDKMSENDVKPVIDTRWMSCVEIYNAKNQIEKEFELLRMN